jgi:CheY-specific phosphatase CheX
MVSQDRSAMKDAISEVLETMFFVYVDFGGDLSSKQFGDCESLVSLFNDAERVDISLRTSEEFARMISANLLGVEEGEVSQDDLEDTMKEFANMVGGNFKARIDSQNHWELGIPRFMTLTGLECVCRSGLVFSCYGKPMGEVNWQSVSNGGNE